MSIHLFVQPWREANGFISRCCHAVKQQLALHQLNRRVDELLAAAEDHNAFGLPRGHEHFQELHRQANQEVDRYCTTWEQDRHRLVAELPNLSRLEHLGHKSRTSPGSFVVGGCAGAVLLGAVFGLCHVAYSVVVRLAH